MRNLHAHTLSVRATENLGPFGSKFFVEHAHSKMSISAFVQVLMEIYGNTLNSKFSSTVHEEAMAAIGDIAFVIGSRFVQYLERAA
tara:strand:- start:270 stop:527 length:258 start_codon:yes stop_codon:yes gene_type:complete